MLEGEDSEDLLEEVHEPPVDVEEATERTPLVRSESSHSNLPQTHKSALFSLFSPVVVSTVLGLLIGLIKPVQRFIVGREADGMNGSWFWQSFGSGLVVLGAGFALVELIALGAAIRAGEKKS